MSGDGSVAKNGPDHSGTSYVNEKAENSKWDGGGLHYKREPRLRFWHEGDT